MSAADSTTAVTSLEDDITRKLKEAMKECEKTEDQTNVHSGERNVGYTTNPSKKTCDISDIIDKAPNKVGTVGYTADPPLTPSAEEDSDLFGGHTPVKLVTNEFSHHLIKFTF